MPYADPEKRRQCILKWKAANKEKISQQSKIAYAIKHPPKEKTLSVEIKKQKKAAKNKRYRDKHRESVLLAKRVYYTANKKLIARRSRERRRADIQYRMASNLRLRLNSALRGRRRAGSAVRDLGCSIEIFKTYVESKFQPGMSWDNWGEWHLDHIKPLCKFDLTDREQFLVVAHYTNYQPLWAADNIRKGSKCA